ncbi:hypothetical protein PENTCL1PPCAC_1452, partial [Pristionchus entomophagus]
MYKTMANLNSTDISFAPLLFYAIYTAETVLCVFSLLLAPFAGLALMRAGVIHRNFRLCCVSAVIQLVIACSTRFILLFYQLFDLPRDDVLLIVVSILRDEFFGYFSSVFGAITLERLVATLHTEWYEKEKGTLHVFIIVQAVLVLPSLANALLWIFMTIPGFVNYAFFAVQLVISGSSFLAIYCWNKRLLEKAEVQYIDYSVSRTFQLRENIGMMKVRGFEFDESSYTFSVAFLFYGCYIFLPDHLKNVRSFCVAMFDAWSALEQVVIMYLLIKRNQAVFNKFEQLPFVRGVRK